MELEAYNDRFQGEKPDRTHLIRFKQPGSLLFSLGFPGGKSSFSGATSCTDCPKNSAAAAPGAGRCDECTAGYQTEAGSDFPMVFLQFSYGFSTVFLWFFLAKDVDLEI